MTALPITHAWVDALTYVGRTVNARELLERVEFNQASKTHFAYSAIRPRGSASVILWLRSGLLELPIIETQEILTSAVLRCYTLLNLLSRDYEQSLCTKFGVHCGGSGNISERWRDIYARTSAVFSPVSDTRRTCGLCLRPIATGSPTTSGVHTTCLDFARTRLIGRFRPAPIDTTGFQGGILDAD